ncbi:MAG: flagellar basal-body rod protein FlgF [Desulfobulbaceae bacterium]|nr:flagellar basal-body rod protein FlgF [Desulfobulbaceae bacterium]
MVSGKYSALSGAVAREQAMSNIANNMANLSTVGFKKDTLSFESMLNGARQIQGTKGINYNRINTITTDFSQGPLKVTENLLDLALDGKGFFKVNGPDEVYYTRQGDFKLDAEGTLTTQSGHAVLGTGGQPITLTGLTEPISVDDNGNISVGGFPQAQLGIFDFADPSKLKKVGSTLFQTDQDNPEIATEDTRIIQGSLEVSNVNMMEEMVLMINTNRKHEAYHKVLKSYSKLSDKLSELGGVS